MQNSATPEDFLVINGTTNFVPFPKFPQSQAKHLTVLLLMSFQLVVVYLFYSFIYFYLFIFFISFFRLFLID